MKRHTLSPSDLTRCLTYARAQVYEDRVARCFLQVTYALETTLSLELPAVLAALVTARDELATRLLASGKLARG